MEHHQVERVPEDLVLAGTDSSVCPRPAGLGGKHPGAGPAATARGPALG